MGKSDWNDLTATFANPDGCFYAELRNGVSTRIIGINLFWRNEEYGVGLKILGGSGKLLRGGAQLPHAAMEEICKKYLTARGYKVFGEDETPIPVTNDVYYRLGGENVSAQALLTHEGVIGDLWEHPTEDDQQHVDTFSVLWSDIESDSKGAE